jgi:hypothetical protein
MGGYAKWSEFEDQDITINSLRSGAIELEGEGPDETGTLTYDGSGLTLVSGGGDLATKIGPDSLEFGANALRIDEDGDIAYCKGGAGGCQKLQTA